MSPSPNSGISISFFSFVETLKKYVQILCRYSCSLVLISLKSTFSLPGKLSNDYVDGFGDNYNKENDFGEWIHEG